MNSLRNKVQDNHLKMYYWLMEFLKARIDKELVIKVKVNFRAML